MFTLSVSFVTITLFLETYLTTFITTILIVISILISVFTSSEVFLFCQTQFPKVFSWLWNDMKIKILLVWVSLAWLFLPRVNESMRGIFITIPEKYQNRNDFVSATTEVTTFLEQEKLFDSAADFESISRHESNFTQDSVTQLASENPSFADDFAASDPVTADSTTTSAYSDIQPKLLEISTSYRINLQISFSILLTVSIILVTWKFLLNYVYNKNVVHAGPDYFTSYLTSYYSTLIIYIFTVILIMLCVSVSSVLFFVA